MPLREARSIDQLYTSVADYDITFTHEAPLALALDNRVHKPRIGRLSATPRSYAVNQMFPDDVRPLFFEVVDRTSLSWKQASRALELCINCWNETGDRTRILDYNEFDTPSIRSVVSLLGELESSYQTITGTTVQPDQSIAVIDETQLSALDHQFLSSPNDYDTYSSLGTNHVSFPKLQIFPSATAIISTIVEQITPETADQFGVVLVEGSIYSALIESALEAKDIPFRGGAGFADDDDVRRFFRLLETIFAGSNQRVSEISPVLATVGIDLPTQSEQQRVDSVSSAQLGAYAEFRQKVENGTFRDALSQYELLADTQLSELRREFEALKLLDKPVTEDNVNRVRYYIDAFSIPTDATENEGVLLAGAASTAYVDRPVVFYVGLGHEWAQSPPDYPWIDQAEYIERDLERFQRLLQNGQQRYYFVQKAQAGSDITPCVYLRQILDESFETFDDLPHERFSTTAESESLSPFSQPDQSVHTSKKRETISQSRLNGLVNSPRDVYFDRLVESPSSLNMIRGTVLHEAAEIYVVEPSLLEDQREEVLDAMCARLDPYLSDSKRAVQRTKLEIGLDAIIAYLDEYPPVEREYGTYDNLDRENKLATALGVDCESPIIERWFESTAIGMHGYIDLLQDATTLVDYKTGKKKSVSEILDAASIDPVDEKPNFQALVYLAKHREERPDERLEIRFVHLLHEADEAIAGTPVDPIDLVSTITYVPATFSEFVASRDTFDTVTDYADSNDRCRTLDKLGYEAYREFFETHALPREGEDPERREKIRNAFIAYAQERVGEYQYVQDGCELVIDDLDDVPEGYVLESDLDVFEEFVAEQVDALNRYRSDRFPVAYREDGPTWNRVDNRDLILTDR